MHKKTKFIKIGDRPSLPEELASILLRQIAEGDFLIGDVLPSEQALAGLFHVSRTVVREALARLKFEGIIRSKRGSGPVVCALPTTRIGLELPIVLSDKDKLKIIEFRIIVEGECAALAAVKCSEAQIKKLHSFLKEMEQSVDARQSGLLPDYHFHCFIAEIADNEYLSAFIKSLSAPIAGVVQGARFLSNQALEKAMLVLEEHNAIYKAIQAKQPEEARKAVHNHLISSVIRQNLPLSGPMRYYCQE